MDSEVDVKDMFNNQSKDISPWPSGNAHSNVVRPERAIVWTNDELDNAQNNP